MTLLPWPFPPVRYTDEWDVLEAAFVILAGLGIGLGCALAFIRTRHNWHRIWIGCLVVSVAVWAHEWSGTTCFARVPSPERITSVEELGASNYSQLLEFKQRGLPVVVRGLLNSSITLNDWSPNELAAKYGSSMIEVQLGNVEQKQTVLHEIPLWEFLQGIQNEEWLASRSPSKGKLPYFAEQDELFDENPRLALAARRLVDALGVHDVGFFHYQTLFWIGPAGSVTGLHMDVDAFNVLCQVYGSKKIWIYPIAQSHLLYPSSKYDLGASLAMVDHFAPDFDRFPLFKQAQPLEVEVHAGDVIFIPSHWYHACQASTVSVSVSVRLYTMCESLAAAPLTVLDILHQWGLYRHNDCVCHSPVSEQPY